MQDCSRPRGPAPVPLNWFPAKLEPGGKISFPNPSQKCIGADSCPGADKGEGRVVAYRPPVSYHNKKLCRPIWRNLDETQEGKH